MNQAQVDRMHSGKGFIAALDQSGGSTPKALKAYGIDESEYEGNEEMFDMVHKMRARIMTAPSFTSDNILATILFDNTLDKQVEGVSTTEYLLSKGILPILKVDLGLAEIENRVQVMKPITNLKDILEKAVENKVFGTKMRSFIRGASAEGIRNVVEQQFAIAKEICSYGLVPIIEPEVDITIADKAEAEAMLKDELAQGLQTLSPDQKVMLKLSLPTTDNFYAELMDHPNVVRIVALSGGYSQADADEILARNNGMIASFSRALSVGLFANQTDEEFDQILGDSIRVIAAASNT